MQLEYEPQADHIVLPTPEFIHVPEEEVQSEAQAEAQPTDKEKEKTRVIQEAIQQKRPVFLMLYMKTCGPCQRAHPEWLGLREHRHRLPNDLLFADIESQFLTPDVNLGVEPEGFPSMYYFRNGAKTSEFDQEMGAQRTLDNLLQWIQKVHPLPKRHRAPKSKKQKKRRKTRGGGRRRRRTRR